jgi:hypothetical protein
MRIPIRGTLSADVADAGTFTVSYPNALAPEIAAPTDEGDFYAVQGHQIVIAGNQALDHPRYLDITLGTASVTVTNKSGATWLAGSSFILHLELPGKAVYASRLDGQPIVRMARMSRGDTMWINLGAPDALVTNGVMAAQNRTNAGALLVNGSIAVSGLVTLDRPRNLIAKSGGADTAVITCTGKDEYGVTMKETITLNGTTAVSGKKAFKQVSALDASAAIANTAFIGTGDVLGLPVHVPAAGFIIKELENGTVATAGTFAAGWTTAGAHTATGADIRGTIDPNSACDADKVFQILVALPDAGYRGVAQYAG